MMQPLSELPGTALDSDSTALPLSLSDSATVPAAKLLAELALVALNAAQVPAPASAPSASAVSEIFARRLAGLWARWTARID